MIHILPLIACLSFYLLLKFLAAKAYHNHFSNCKHINQSTKTIEVAATCITTVEVCDDCGKVLTQPKTDC